MQSFSIKREINSRLLIDLKLHFGCGHHNVANMINVDLDLNSETPISSDLSLPSCFLQNLVEVLWRK